MYVFCNHVKYCINNFISVLFVRIVKYYCCTFETFGMVGNLKFQFLLVHILVFVTMSTVYSKIGDERLTVSQA